MLAVLAYDYDEAARWLVAHWRDLGIDAGVLGARDLSQPGWVHVPGDEAAGRCVVDGQRVATRELRGVLSRMPCVSDAELGGLHPEDRGYAAAEMQAFLLAWLTSLACPVLNRPTAHSLAGPAWGVEQWTHEARHVGLPTRTLVRGSRFGDPPVEAAAEPDLISLDLIGERGFRGGRPVERDEDRALVEASRRLARHANVSLLRTSFSRAGGETRFVGADFWLDCYGESEAEALTELLLGPAALAPAALAPLVAVSA